MHAALHQAAAVVVLVLGSKRVFMRAVDDALPQRSDQVQEPGRFDDLPAVGFEFVRGLVRHVVVSIPCGLSCGPGHFI